MSQHLSNDRLTIILCIALAKRVSTAELDSFKHALMDHAAVGHVVESTGAFDLMIELDVPDHASFDQFMSSFAYPLTRLAHRYETCPVHKRHRRVRRNDGSFWVPCRDGIQRIACSDIDRIEAERDYVRIHCGPKSWLMKATMTKLMERLGSNLFIQVHRSTIVRRSFIRNLEKSHRGWEAHLRDGSRQSISRSHLPDILGLIDPEANASLATGSLQSRTGNRPFNKSAALGPSARDRRGPVRPTHPIGNENGTIGAVRPYAEA